MKIKEICSYLDQWAPAALAEDYDNVGLIVGQADTLCSGVLVSLDITLAVIEEAIVKKCNLIIAHHPPIFKGLKRITDKNLTEKIVYLAIKNDIALYAIHTNLDNLKGGVNFKIAEKLGLSDVKILRPIDNNLLRITVLIQSSHRESVMDAAFRSGAGNIGEYAECSFTTEGTGTFMPSENASPFVGIAKVRSAESEVKLDFLVPNYLQNVVLNAIKNAQPYEELAYYAQPLQNQNQDTGSGAVGTLKEPMATLDFLKLLKENLKVKCIRHTELCKNKISTVAVCGGVGSFLLNDAINAQADIFVSADFKYHEFFGAENKIIIADIGHFESEQFTKDLILEKLSKKFTNFASYLSEVNTNPINYFH